MSEEYFDELKFNRLDGMSYYRENEIQPEIEDLIRNHKKIFLHCYNLEKNNTIEQKYMAYFYMILFNEFYYLFFDDIEVLFKNFENDYVGIFLWLFKIAKEDILSLCDCFYDDFRTSDKKKKSKFVKLLNKVNAKISSKTKV